jgi:hypothetical protein
MKITIKILVIILLAAAAVAVIHHLPNFQSLMREIHGR